MIPMGVPPAYLWLISTYRLACICHPSVALCSSAFHPLDAHQTGRHEGSCLGVCRPVRVDDRHIHGWRSGCRLRWCSAGQMCITGPCNRSARHCSYGDGDAQSEVCAGYRNVGVSFVGPTGRGDTVDGWGSTCVRKECMNMSERVVRERRFTALSRRT